MTIKDICDIETRCTGCGVCAAICSTHAVQMLPNEEGFLVPTLNESLCQNCGLCVKGCGVEQIKKRNTNGIVFYGHAKEPIARSLGSSGGFFGILSKKVISEGGVVYGAIFDGENKKICHKSTLDVSLQQILRSKYAQSDMGNTYRAIKTDLLAGRKVLFCGTPCQVRALKSFLQVNRIEGNLLTVDFFCHGVPSNKLFADLLLDWEQEEKSKIIDFTFREKDLGWRTQVLKAYFENGNIRKEVSLQCFYYYYFVKSYNLRDCCYICDEYAAHVADITMADYWSISPKMDDNLGTSLLVVNTNQGRIWLDLISDELILNNYGYKKINYEYYNHSSYNIRRKVKWREAYEKYGFEYIKTTYFRKMIKKEQFLSSFKRPFIRFKAKMISILKREV